MVGVRLPAARLKQVDKIAAALSCDRSGAIRWLLDLAMMGLPRALLRSGSAKEEPTRRRTQGLGPSRFNLAHGA
jgi:hypothetical protein